ncbi:putative protein phosphatase [Paratrimastix pyriformis]|uniref:Serine/threonine-protein phosphatase n=1 Tax=Paratrimastix pyriformis TaxID=342808 RepID=A0ABQ8UJU7_9EUKA|nr:putative protein phosphatase [Paratrimastix pyriformis]
MAVLKTLAACSAYIISLEQKVNGERYQFDGDDASNVQQNVTEGISGEEKRTALEEDNIALESINHNLKAQVQILQAQLNQMDGERYVMHDMVAVFPGNPSGLSSAPLAVPAQALHPPASPPHSNQQLESPPQHSNQQLESQQRQLERLRQRIGAPTAATPLGALTSKAPPKGVGPRLLERGLQPTAHHLFRNAALQADPLEAICAIINRFEEHRLLHPSPLYMHTGVFLRLCEDVRAVVAAECKLVEMRSPVYIFGDLHGNYPDLSFYLQRFNPTGRIGLSPHAMLFLGDYVDRGEFGVEVVTRLFIDKLVNPRAVVLLRGNHELAYVNGQTGIRHFRERGEEVWRAFNRVFDCLPIAATIDGQLFCVHGGLPRPFPFEAAPQPGPEQPQTALVAPGRAPGRPLNDPDAPDHWDDHRLQMLRSFPAELPGTVEFAAQCPALSDCLWADPAPPGRPLDRFGYCRGIRGEESVMFGSPAVDEFLERHGFTMVIRGHEDQTNGAQLSMGGRLFTVFSSSNYRDHNSAACLLCHQRRGPGHSTTAVRSPSQAAATRLSALGGGAATRWAAQQPGTRPAAAAAGGPFASSPYASGRYAPPSGTPVRSLLEMLSPASSPPSSPPQQTGRASAPARTTPPAQGQGQGQGGAQRGAADQRAVAPSPSPSLAPWPRAGSTPLVVEELPEQEGEGEGRPLASAGRDDAQARGWPGAGPRLLGEEDEAPPAHGFASLIAPPPPARMPRPEEAAMDMGSAPIVTEPPDVISSPPPPGEAAVPVVQVSLADLTRAGMPPPGPPSPPAQEEPEPLPLPTRPAPDGPAPEPRKGDAEGAGAESSESEAEGPFDLDAALRETRLALALRAPATPQHQHQHQQHQHQQQQQQAPPAAS